MERQELIDKMRTVVAEALALEEDEVQLKSRLIADLDADSLDFVDILFQVEKQVGVKLRPEDLNFLRRLDFSSSEVVKDGFVTKETIDKLKEWLPALGDVPDQGQVTPAQLSRMISVETLVIVAEKQLAKQGA